MSLVRAGFRVPRRSDFELFVQLLELRDVLARLEIDCVFDVGANVGRFGRHLRRLGYQGWIVSFEPGVQEYTELVRQCDDKWLTYPLALGRENKTMSLNIMPRSEMNSFRASVDQKSVGLVEVPMRRVEGLFDEIRHRTGARRLFLKTDTQGFDLDVVQGAGERHVEFSGLMSELSVKHLYHATPHYTDVLNEYEKLGFVLHSLHVVNRTASGGVLEYDCIMARA